MAKKPAGKIQWVKKAAFVMPVLPMSLKIDPIVAGFLHVIAFLELSEDETIDPDASVEAMEHVGYYFERLSPDAKASFAEQVARVAKHARKQKWGHDAVEFFSDFIDNFGTDGEDDE